MDWRPRTCAPEPDRGPSRLRRASAKGGSWHQNNRVSLAYRSVVQKHNSEAPEIGGATSASPVACRALQAAVPPRLRSRHGDLRVSASSKCLPCCLMLCWDVRFRPACLDSSHSSKHLIQVKLGLTGTTIPMKHYVHASVSARPSMLVSIGWPTGSGVLIGPWPEATDSGKGKSSQYGGGARLGAATVAGDDGG